MELRILGLDPIPGSGNGFGSVSVDVEVSKQKWDTRFEGFKQEGSGFCGGDAWRASKMAKTQVDFSLASTADAAVYSDAHMLRFSSGSKLESSALPYFHNMEAAHVKNSGYYSSGGSMDPSTGGVRLLSGIGGPFTPSQWLELEQQALIYRYVTANEPVPVHLLIPIRKAFESAGFYGINGAALKPTAWGWGPFHLGYSNSTDPEPGRCRRTDGKKWRCSRDAVINQKYCEKHMNRGRHRSRKHVEGQGTVSGATKSSTTKSMPPSSVLPGGGSSNSFDINQHQQIQGKSLQPTTSNPSMNASLNKMIVNRENSGQTLQDAAQLSFMSEGINLNSNGNSLSISKHQICSQEPALNGFGAISSESLMDAAASRRSYDPYTQVFNKQGENESRNSLCTFLDDWPVNHSSTDIMSSTTSPANEKAAVSPLRLSQEHEIEIGFGSQVQSPIQAAANWKPISWEGPMGGPLGEALQSSSISNSTDESRKSSALSLLPRGWDGIGSCQVSTTSPTGILQRSALVSLSNSSAGSSPIADNSKTIESGGNFVN